MKYSTTRKFASLVILMMLITGCQKDNTVSQSQDLSEIHDLNPEIEAYNEAAVSPTFEFPGETETITLYSCNSTAYMFMIDPMIDAFEKQYPQVSVNLVQFKSTDEFMANIRVEIAAGAGPDLLYVQEADLPDIQKTMTANVFMDLNPYMANDPDYNHENYIGNVSQFGILGESQYLLPIQQNIPFFMTTHELLEDANIEKSMLDTYDGFLEACVKYRQKYPKNNFIVENGLRDSNTSNMTLLYQINGFHFLDYSKHEVTIDQKPLQEMLDLCKLYYRKSTFHLELKEGDYCTRDCLLNRDCLFTDYLPSGNMVIQSACSIKAAGETPELYLIPSYTGETVSQISTYTAIPQKAVNKLNAWRMIKVLLSDKIQGDSHAMGIWYPVTVSAISIYWENSGAPMAKDIAAEAEREMRSIDRAILLPPVLSKYLDEYMKDCINGSDTFEHCFDKLKSTLELYIDE